MRLIFYLSILLGMVVLQKVASKFHISNRIFAMGVNQLGYSTLLFYLIKVPYNFRVQFVGFWWFLLLFSLTLVFGRYLTAEQTRLPSELNFLTVLSVGISMPISEEILFRGVLLYVFPSAMLNATVFSLVHLLNVFSRSEGLSLYNLLYRFVVGYVFSMSVLKTNSLFCPLFCHILNNFVGLLLLFFSEHIPKKSN